MKHSEIIFITYRMAKYSNHTFIMSACLYLLLVLFIGISFSANIDGFDTLSGIDPLPGSGAGIMLFNSVNVLPRPSWVSEQQVIRYNKLIPVLGITEQLRKNSIADNLNGIYTNFKEIGYSDSAIFDLFLDNTTIDENGVIASRTPKLPEGTTTTSEAAASTTALKLPAELISPPDDTTIVYRPGGIKLPRAERGSATAAVSEVRPATTAENTTTTYALIGVFSVVGIITLTLLIRSR